MERFKMIASGYIFLIKDEKILLARRFQTGYADGMYALPAGHIEDNETLTFGTSRELKEEIGLEIPPSDLKLVHLMHRRSDDIRMDFFFTVDSWGGEPKNCEPNKCDDLDWFPLAALPENTVPYIRYALEQFQQGNFYSEFGWGQQ